MLAHNLQTIKKIGFFLTGNGNPVIGFQDNIPIGLYEFLDFVQVDDVAVMNAEKRLRWQNGVYFLQFLGK